MINTDTCKKIVYAIEQTASASWNQGLGKLPKKIDDPLQAAIVFLEKALREAAATDAE